MLDRSSWKGLCWSHFSKPFPSSKRSGCTACGTRNVTLLPSFETEPPPKRSIDSSIHFVVTDVKVHFRANPCCYIRGTLTCPKFAKRSHSPAQPGLAGGLCPRIINFNQINALNIPSKMNDKEKQKTEAQGMQTVGILQHVPGAGPKHHVLGGGLSGKAHGYASPIHSKQPSSSLHATQITAPSRLYSAALPSEKDEYLLQLLRKGMKPPPSQPPSAIPQSSPSEICVPNPVPRRTEQFRGQAPPPPTGAREGGSIAPPLELKPLVLMPPSLPQRHVDKAQKPEIDRPPSSTWCFADTQQRMGKDAAQALQSRLVSHQVAFLDQLYGFHRSLAIQSFLVKQCPEVREVMAEAERLVAIAGGQGEGSSDQPAKKRVCKGGGTEGVKAIVEVHPTLSQDDKLLQPDSQFAELPLSRDTATDNGDTRSGEEGVDDDGSGGVGGSGGGSTSPQPQAQGQAQPPLQAPGVVPAQCGNMNPEIMRPASSGASQTPFAAFPCWGGGAHQTAMAYHPMMMQQGLCWGGNPDPANGMQQQAQQQQFPGMMKSLGDKGTAMIGMADPMMWWYYDYYGRQAVNSARARVPAPDGNMAAKPAAMHNQVPTSPPVVGPQPIVHPSLKWWQDPWRTFGPPADLEEVSRAAAALAAARRGTLDDSGVQQVEVESARIRSTAPDPPGATILYTTRKIGKAAVTKSAGARQPPCKLQTTGRLVSSPIHRSKKRRKPADPIDEASSGTSGQNQQMVPPNDLTGGHADANVANLLLTFRGQ